jgi:dGTPase
LIKYPWTSVCEPVVAWQARRGKVQYLSGRAALFRGSCPLSLGLIRKGPHQWARHPLSYLMEAADDICYAILDLEDAVEIGILNVHEFENVARPPGGVGQTAATV